MPRQKVASSVEIRVLLECARRCALCYGLNRDLSEKRGQIAHIDRDATNSREKNLAYLCFDHHDAYDSRSSQSKGFISAELLAYKQELVAAVLSRRLNPASAELSANAKGFREEMVKGRLKYAAYCLVKGEEECRKFIAKMNIQRVRKPELMGARMDALEVQQMEMLSRYRDRERELDQYVDHVVCGNEVGVPPNVVVGRYKHRLTKLDEALHALIQRLS